MDSSHVTILIIEDEVSIREIIGECLQAEGYQILEAEDGLAGVHQALLCQPDLILCDVMMPKLDGYEVLQRLQANQQTQSIPFIFLTAKGEKENFRYGMELGADDYLTKPFTVRELLKAVLTRLRKRSSVLDSGDRALTATLPAPTQQRVGRDLLTNLPMRWSLGEPFHQLYQDYLGQQQRQAHIDWCLPLFCLSLDRFERITTTLGYDCGDQLLQAAALRLQDWVGDRGFLARLSSSAEFAILFHPLPYDQVIALSEQVLQRFAEPFLLNDLTVIAPLSVGVVMAPVHGTMLNPLLQAARTAKQQAQQLGGNHAQMYQPSPQYVLPNASDMIVLETDLRYAIARNELRLYYQPQVCLTSGEIIGAEALIRWQHPTRGLMTPGHFIPIAEETNLIESISHWVVQQATQQAMQWRQAGLGSLRMAVNISACHFNHPDSCQRLIDLLTRAIADYDALELEITESSLMYDSTVTVERFHQLKRLGMQIAIDDFGTGYAALHYLQQFPFDSLKIDQCFVQNIDQNAKNQVILRTIFELAQCLELRVVAEGVETAAELEMLRRYRCDEIQGYLFSPPVPGPVFTEFLEQHKTLPLTRLLS
ncbi:EAL domain-containing response regulator [Spirulina major]|uniref:EAL domain-containing response regulator n=1 Tax=Spirulina major TaxID=270636 RepID=UPI0009326D0B|nr:EAL domain-containing protein [Spirulina major]